MSRSFEISIPGRESSDALTRLAVEADNWLDALRLGLEEMGDEKLPSDAVCDIQPDGVIRVRDPASGRQFVVRKLTNGQRPRAGVRRIMGSSRPDPDRTAVRPALDAALERRPRVRTGAALKRVSDRNLETQMVPMESGTHTQRERKITPPRQAARTDPFGETSLPKTAGGKRNRQPQMTPRAVPVIGAAEAQRRLQAAATGDHAAFPRATKTDADAPPRSRAKTRPKTTDVITIVCEAVPELENPLLTAEQIIDAAIDLAREHIPCAASQFLLPGPNAAKYRVAAARGDNSGELVRTWLRLEGWLANLVAERPATVRLVELDLTFQYERVRGSKTAYEVDSVLWVPIRHKKRLLAVMTMLNSDNPEGFTDGEVNALDYLSMTLSKALAKHL